MDEETNEMYKKAEFRDLVSKKFCPFMKNTCNGKERNCIGYAEISYTIFEKDQISSDGKPKDGEKPIKITSGNCTAVWLLQMLHDSSEATIKLQQLIAGIVAANANRKIIQPVGGSVITK